MGGGGDTPVQPVWNVKGNDESQRQQHPWEEFQLSATREVIDGGAGGGIINTAP